jgi:hypothetical protein
MAIMKIFIPPQTTYFSKSKLFHDLVVASRAKYVFVFQARVSGADTDYYLFIHMQ